MHLVIKYLLAALLAFGGALSAACSPSEPVLPTNSDPAGVADLITGSRGPAFLREVSVYGWKDRGQRAGRLLGWVPADAESPDPRSTARAGQTAHALAVFLAQNSDELRRSNVGARNTSLMSAYVGALIPYQGAMVGAPSATRGFLALDDMSTTLPNTRKLFAFLATDSADHAFAGGALRQAESFERDFAAVAAADPSLSAADTHDAQLSGAARLLGLVSSTATATGTPDYLRLSPAHVIAQLQYTIATRMIHASDVRIEPRFFRPDESLMRPEDALHAFGQSGWNTYAGQLDTYISQYPVLARKVIAFHDVFQSVSG